MPKTHLKKFYQEQLEESCQDLSLSTGKAIFILTFLEWLIRIKVRLIQV